MPEGDTIHKIAAFMAPLLEQRVARRVQAKHESFSGLIWCTLRR